MALLTKVQAAEELNVKVGTLDNWRWTGRGPAFVRVVGEVRYRMEDLRKFITENTRQPSVQAFMEERRAAL